jgi:BirA family biotin operon repressor/biotin-[acetyl-CoA-carboxylase] ligase
MGLPDWSLRRLQAELAPALPGFVAELAPSIDSTNSELMRRARAGKLQPVLLVAETQTAGRGRLGRQWQSASPRQIGDSLTFSLGLPLPATVDWSGLSLAVGVCLATSLDAPSTAGKAGPRIGLKWPNDLWLQQRKLGGVLIETMLSAATRYAVIGVGINIVRPVVGAFSIAPAGLEEIDPACDAAEALRRVAGPLVATVQRFGREGFRAFQSAFAERDVLFGMPVVAGQWPAEATSTALAGEARGVDASGALLVHTAAGMSRITSSDVSVRPSEPAPPQAPSGD